MESGIVGQQEEEHLQRVPVESVLVEDELIILLLGFFLLFLFSPG